MRPKIIFVPLRTRGLGRYGFCWGRSLDAYFGAASLYAAGRRTDFIDGPRTIRHARSGVMQQASRLAVLEGKSGADRWRLVRHDALVLRKGFAAAFSTWRDRLLLAIVLLLGLLWLRDAASKGHWLEDVRLGIGIGAVLGWATGRGLLRRLADHAAEGLLAADALDRATRATYLAVGAVLPALALAGLAALAQPAALGWLGAGFLGGIVASRLVPIVFSVRFAVGRSRLGKADGWSGVNPLMLAALLALTSALLGRAGLAWRGEAGAALILTASTFLSLAWLVRIDAKSCRFLALAGHGPWRSAAAQLAPGGACVLLSTSFALLLGGGLAFIAPALVGVALLAIATARIWLYSLYPRRAADWLLTIALVVLGLLAVAAPPIAPLLLLAIGVDLNRRAARARWMMP
jgi:hypothetical protein